MSSTEQEARGVYFLFSIFSSYVLL